MATADPKADPPEPGLRPSERQAEALENLVRVLDPNRKARKRVFARLVGAMMLASSGVLAGYEFLAWVIDQWQRREMIANWVAVAREMQDVENSPEIALELLEKADELDPQHPDVVRLRAYVRGMQAVKRLLILDRPFSKADLDSAARAAAEASLLEQIDGGEPDWALLRGQLSMAMNEPERARDYLNRALEISPDAVLALVRLSQLAEREGVRLWTSDAAAAERSFDESRRLLDRALQIDPSSKWAMLYLGLLEFQLAGVREDPSLLEKADVWFARSLEVDGRFELAVRNRGIVAFSLERWDDAERFLQRALELDPESSGALVVLAQVHGFQDEYESARLYARRAIEFDPGLLGGWVFLGDVNRDMATIARESGREADANARAEEAIEAYGKAMELDPRSADVRIERSRLLRRMGKIEESGRDARDARRLAPGDPYAVFAEAEHQFFVAEQVLKNDPQQWNATLKTTLEILAIDPSFDTAHLMAARCLRALGRPDEADTSLAKALEVAEVDRLAELHLERASWRESAGNLEGMLEDAIAARNADPEMLKAWLAEARAMIGLSRVTEACEALRQASERSPGDEEIAELRSRAGCDGAGS